MILQNLLCKRLDEKWELSNEHLIATFIHSNLKHFHMCPHLKERAIFLLKQELLKLQKTVQPIRSSCSSSTPIRSCSSTSTASMSCLSSATSVSSTNFSARKRLLMSVYDKQHEVPEKSSVEEELEKYLASTSIIQDEEDYDILGY